MSLLKKISSEYISIFDSETGQGIRVKRDRISGKLLEDDPFMADFPELLDVGIMGHCKHGKSGLCQKAGIGCYQNGLSKDMPNMSLEDFKRLAEECEGKTLQFALGGCGDPDEHESFEDILRISREHKIIPNFTTSGLAMTKEKAYICKKYCGAVAVSWYRSEYTSKAIKELCKSEVKTNIHYVLSKKTIGEALQRLKEQTFPTEVNAIIFLLHKPVGQGRLDDVIRWNEREKLWELLRYISDNMEKLPWKIGFDSCIAPALLQNEFNFPDESIDTCEGARWGAYVSPDMKLIPCSFANDMIEWQVDLRNSSISAAWRSPVFERFRDCLRKSCEGGCRTGKHDLCMGGCPLVPDIVLCGEKKTQRKKD